MVQELQHYSLSGARDSHFLDLHKSLTPTWFPIQICHIQCHVLLLTDIFSCHQLLPETKGDNSLLSSALYAHVERVLKYSKVELF